LAVEAVISELVSGLEIAKAPRVSEENSIAYQRNSPSVKAGKIFGLLSAMNMLLAFSLLFNFHSAVSATRRSSARVVPLAACTAIPWITVTT
jgi:hypothetical protein